MWVVLKQMHFLWSVRERRAAEAPSLHRTSPPVWGAARLSFICCLSSTQVSGRVRQATKPSASPAPGHQIRNGGSTPHPTAWSKVAALVMAFSRHWAHLLANPKHPLQERGSYCPFLQKNKEANGSQLLA